MTFKGILAPLLALTACGCVSQMVEKRRPRLGPIKEVGYIEKGGGEVKYSTEGWRFFVAGRRRNALLRMRRLCRPLQAVIIEEFIRQDVEVPYSQDDIEQNLDKGLSHYTVAPYQHVIFECQPAKEGAR